MNDWDAKSFDWPINSDSVVVEIGGYKGRWAKEIASRYNPHLYIFEPQQWAYEICRNELVGSKAYVFDCALVFDDSVVSTIGDFGTDGASLVKSGHANNSVVKTMNIGEACSLLKLTDIDLLLMNIEGYEFTLLPHMIETGMLNKIRYLMVQFHMFASSELEYNFLKIEIEKTHRKLWDYGPTLIAWDKIG